MEYIGYINRLFNTYVNLVTDAVGLPPDASRIAEALRDRCSSQWLGQSNDHYVWSRTFSVRGTPSWRRPFVRRAILSPHTKA